MSTHSGPTWYEILGVEPSASSAEIKAAWRDATDKFEPGAGNTQFRLFNEAADVLLDPAKRSAYDASLGGATTVPPAVEPVETPEPTPDVSPEPTPEPTPDATPDVEPVETPEPTPEPTPAPASGSLLDRLRSASLRTVVMVCVPVLVLAAVLIAVTAGGANIGSVHLGSDAEQVQAADDGNEAMAAAERALTAVLAYDYQRMEADRTRAVGFLTPAYAETFNKNFSLLIEGADGKPGPAVQTKTVVTADVLGTGVVDAEKDRVRVVAFVNQTSQKPDRDPAIFQNRLVVTMVKSGDAWLISDLKTY